jgi:hypothetical protein
VPGHVTVPLDTTPVLDVLPAERDQEPPPRARRYTHSERASTVMSIIRRHAVAGRRSCTVARGRHNRRSRSSVRTFYACTGSDGRHRAYGRACRGAMKAAPCQRTNLG